MRWCVFGVWWSGEVKGQGEDKFNFGHSEFEKSKRRDLVVNEYMGLYCRNLMQTHKNMVGRWDAENVVKWVNLSVLLLLSHFSCVWLCATPEMGFSRQEHWNGLPFPSPMHESESEVTPSCPTLSNYWYFKISFVFSSFLICRQFLGVLSSIF